MGDVKIDLIYGIRWLHGGALQRTKVRMAGMKVPSLAENPAQPVATACLRELFGDGDGFEERGGFINRFLIFGGGV